jgi:hypothetical protein
MITFIENIPWGIVAFAVLIIQFIQHGIILKGGKVENLTVIGVVIALCYFIFKETKAILYHIGHWDKLPRNPLLE